MKQYHGKPRWLPRHYSPIIRINCHDYHTLSKTQATLQSRNFSTARRRRRRILNMQSECTFDNFVKKDIYTRRDGPWELIAFKKRKGQSALCKPNSKESLGAKVMCGLCHNIDPLRKTLSPSTTQYIYMQMSKNMYNHVRLFTGSAGERRVSSCTCPSCQRSPWSRRWSC